VTCPIYNGSLLRLSNFIVFKLVLFCVTLRISYFSNNGEFIRNKHLQVRKTRRLRFQRNHCVSDMPIFFNGGILQITTVYSVKFSQIKMIWKTLRLKKGGGSFLLTHLCFFHIRAIITVAFILMLNFILYFFYDRWWFLVINNIRVNFIFFVHRQNVFFLQIWQNLHKYSGIFFSWKIIFFNFYISIKLGGFLLENYFV